MNFKSIARIIISMCVLLLNSCSNKSESPGLCSLNCDNAIIAPIEGRLIPLVSSYNYSCGAGQGGQPVSDPVLIKYLAVYQEASGQGQEAAATTNDLISASRMPLASLSFEPVIFGQRSSAPEHNPNVEINGDIITPAKYKGVLTPRDNWCTDTCGVASVEVVPLCPPAGESSELSDSIQSGALAPGIFDEGENSVVVTISTPDSQ